MLIDQIMAHQALYIYECCHFWLQSRNKRGVFMEDFTYVSTVNHNFLAPSVEKWT